MIYKKFIFICVFICTLSGQVFSQNITLIGSDICTDGTISTEIGLSDTDPNAFYALFCNEQRVSLRQLNSGRKPNPISFGEFAQPGVYTVVQFSANSNDFKNPANGKLISGKIHIKPIPKIFLQDKPIQVKSGEIFSYTPKSDINDANFIWSATVAEGKLKRFDANGKGHIALPLINTGDKPAKVLFSITPVAPDYLGGCTGTVQQLIVLIEVNEPKN